MSRFSRLALAGGLVVLAAVGETHGVTFVDVKGFKDPDAKMIPAGAKVFVTVHSDDLELRCALEDSLAGELKERASLDAVRAYVQFPPTRSITSMEVENDWRSLGLTHVFSVVAGERRLVGEQVRVDFKVEVGTRDAGPLLWTGTAKARLGMFSDATDVAEEVSEELVVALEEQGIVPPRKRKSARP